MNIKSEKELVTEYAKAFNKLDAKSIGTLLADDFHYSSQKVFSEINSKKEYLNYFENKLRAIKDSNTKIDVRLALYNSKYCLAIYQTGKNGGTRTATLLVETNNGKISSAIMCMIPSINELQILEEALI